MDANVQVIGLDRDENYITRCGLEGMGTLKVGEARWNGLRRRLWKRVSRCLQCIGLVFREYISTTCGFGS